MGKQRSEADEQVGELLRTAKQALGLSLTFLSRLDGETQHLEVVESSIPLFRDGQTQPQATSFCQAILDGKLPKVIPNVAKLPEAKRLPAARFPRIRSFVSVPVTLSDGTLYGTFCAAGFTSDNQLSKRDQALMEVLAKAAATVVEPGVERQRREHMIRARLQPVISAGGPLIVLQPIVSLADGRRVGAEALSRFPSEWAMPPDQVFEQASEIHARTKLELLALRAAAEQLSHADGYLAINLSPDVLVDPSCSELLRDLPASRVLIELSEHDPVQDYAALASTLERHRAEGMRLAIDDVGAGYSSLRHILMTTPDVIKLDRSIVAGVGDDAVLQALVGSLTDFAHDLGAAVVAEGVETSADSAALCEIGVDLGQGWFFGRPGPAEDLQDHYALADAPADPLGAARSA